MCLCVCLLLSVWTAPARGQQPFEAPAATEDPGPWLPSPRSIVGNAYDIAQAPFRLSRGEQLMVLGASGLLVGVVSALDRPAYWQFALDSESAASDLTAPLGAPGRLYDRIGPDRVALGTVGALALGGLAFQDRKLTRTSARVAEAVLYTKLATGLLKGFVGRSRPYVGDGPFMAAPGEFENEHAEHSMPSGHTARAFAIATVLAHEYDRWWVQIPAYGAAASVGMQRIRSGNHWLSDVVVGGALGYFIGRSVTTHPDPDQNVIYTPILSAQRVGLTIRF